MQFDPIHVLAQATTSGADLQWWGTLGVGGILAGVMFFFYQRAEARHEKTIIEMKQQHEAALLEMKEQAEQDRRELRETVQENTKVIAQNTEVQRAVLEAVKRIVPDARDFQQRGWKGGR